MSYTATVTTRLHIEEDGYVWYSIETEHVYVVGSTLAEVQENFEGALACYIRETYS